jgi:quinol monooxygenase YgiN
MRSISLLMLGVAMVLAGTIEPVTAQSQSSAPASSKSGQPAPVPEPAPPLPAPASPAQSAPLPAPAPVATTPSAPSTPASTPASPPAEASPASAPAAATQPPPPAAPPAPAQAPAAAVETPPGPYYVVTYFNIAPKAARKAAALLRQFADATRKEDGNTELTVLHELGRPGHFAIVELWKDKASATAHAAAMKALGDKLQPMVLAPFDARPFTPLSVGTTKPGTDAKGVVYVLTHVDVFPQGKDDVAALIKTQSEQSEADPGALRFDAVVWDGHANHFHLIEAWADRKSLDAHEKTE